MQVFAGGIRGLMPKLPDGGQQHVGLVAPANAGERATVTPPRADVTQPASARVAPSQTLAPSAMHAQPPPQAQTRAAESGGSPSRQQQQQPPHAADEPMNELPAPPAAMLLDASASEDSESLTSVNREHASVSVSRASLGPQLQRAGAPLGLGLAPRRQETSSASSALFATGVSGRGAPRPTNPVATAMVDVDDSSMSASEGGEPSFPPPVPAALPAYERSTGIIDRDRVAAEAATPIKTSLHAGEYDVRVLRDDIYCVLIRVTKYT